MAVSQLGCDAETPISVDRLGRDYLSDLPGSLLKGLYHSILLAAPQSLGEQTRIGKRPTRIPMRRLRTGSRHLGGIRATASHRYAGVACATHSAAPANAQALVARASDSFDNTRDAELRASEASLAR